MDDPAPQPPGIRGPLPACRVRRRGRACDRGVKRRQSDHNSLTGRARGGRRFVARDRPGHTPVRVRGARLRHRAGVLWLSSRDGRRRRRCSGTSPSRRRAPGAAHARHGVRDARVAAAGGGRGIERRRPGGRRPDLTPLPGARSAPRSPATASTRSARRAAWPGRSRALTARAAGRRPNGRAPGLGGRLRRATCGSAPPTARWATSTTRSTAAAPACTGSSAGCGRARLCPRWCRRRGGWSATSRGCRRRWATARSRRSTTPRARTRSSRTRSATSSAASRRPGAARACWPRPPTSRRRAWSWARCTACSRPRRRAPAGRHAAGELGARARGASAAPTTAVAARCPG